MCKRKQTATQCVKCSVKAAQDLLINLLPGEVLTAFNFARKNIENHRGTFIVIPVKHATPRKKNAVQQCWFYYGNRRFTAIRKSNDHTAYITLA